MDLHPVISGRLPPNSMMWPVSSQSGLCGPPRVVSRDRQVAVEASLVLEWYEAIREFSVQKDSGVRFFLSGP